MIVYVDNLVAKSVGKYRPLSPNSLVTQVILLNLLDALLTLYATGLGIGELNPIMDGLLAAGPINFLVFKVGFVTSLLLFINRFVGHKGTQVYLFLSISYWLVTGWHVFGVLSLYEAL